MHYCILSPIEQRETCHNISKNSFLTTASKVDAVVFLSFCLIFVGSLREVSKSLTFITLQSGSPRESFLIQLSQLGRVGLMRWGDARRIISSPSLNGHNVSTLLHQSKAPTNYLIDLAKGTSAMNISLHL